MTTTCPTCGMVLPPSTERCPQCDTPVAQATTWGQEQPSTQVPDPWESTPAGASMPTGVPPETRNLALLAHLSAFVTFVGIPSFVGPLVVWLWKRDGHPFVVGHALEALNFNLSVLLYVVVGTVLSVVIGFVTLGIGLVLLIPVALAAAVAWIVIVALAAAAASRGEGYRYPLTIRFVR